MSTNAPNDVVEIETTDFRGEDGSQDDETTREEPFNPNDIKINVKTDTLRNLITRLQHSEIDLNTEFQRHPDLWGTGEMSRLIESILIRFPLPAFYFDASDEEKWLVVDGLQRLSSIKRFIIDKKLRLRKLEYLSDKLEGKGYDELERTYIRRIDECPVTLFLIQPGTPSEVKYSIFRRINTGGLCLNNQEIRNAMVNQNTRGLLSELAKDENLINTIGDQSRRMQDQEHVLRFLAFYFLDYSESKKSITNFLDEMIETMENASLDTQTEYKEVFSRAMQRCWTIFREDAFVNTIDDPSGRRRRRRRKNTALFEVWTTTLASLSEEEFGRIIGQQERLVEKHIEMTRSDNDYQRSISYSTQKKDHHRTRNEKVKQLIKEILSA